jgi:energy-coupling factor transporter ATP-binding protein EcfA2
LLELNDVWYRYPGRTAPALSAIHFAVKSGGICLLAGPSGSGKSTLLQLIAGLLGSADGGEARGCVRSEVRFDLSTGPIHDPAIGLLLQEPARQLHQVSVWDELLSGPAYRGEPWTECVRRATEAAKGCLEASLLPRAPAQLSMGQQQRVALAALLACGCDILLLDEPFACLDSCASRTFADVLVRLAATGRTLLIATHDVTHLGRAADQIVLLDRGKRICSGYTDEILFSEALALTIGQPLSVTASSALFSEEPVSARPLTWQELANEVALRRVPKAAQPVASSTVALSIEGLVAGWADSRVVGPVDFVLYKGEGISVLGPNGAGKTSLFRTLLGIQRPLSGRVVRQFSEDTRSVPLKGAGAVGFITQNPGDMLFEATCLDEATFGPRMLGLTEPTERGREALRFVGLLESAHVHPRRLSIGQQRLLTIAAAIAADPQVILLDEPEFGLDKNTWELVERVLLDYKKRGVGLLVATHSLDVAIALSERALLLGGGRVQWLGGTDDLQEDVLVAAGLSTPGAALHLAAARARMAARSKPDLAEALRLLLSRKSC